MLILKNFKKDYPRFEFHDRPDASACCFLRVQARKQDQRIVLLVTQLSNYYGPSVTNNIEIITQRAFRQLQADEVVAKVNTDASGGPISTLFRKILRIEEPKISIGTLYDSTACIEHYPAGVGLAPDGSYSLVAFDEGESPVWNYVSRDVAANQAGVEPNFLDVETGLLTYER